MKPEEALAARYGPEAEEETILKQLNDEYFLESGRLYHQDLDGDLSSYREAPIGRIACLFRENRHESVTIYAGTSTLTLEAGGERIDIRYDEDQRPPEAEDEPIRPGDLVTGAALIRDDHRSSRPAPARERIDYGDLQRLKDLFRDLGIDAPVRMREENILDRLRDSQD